VIIDSSAIAAILFKELEADEFLNRIYAAGVVRLSTANYVELSIVITSQFGESHVLQYDDFLQRSKIVLEPVTIEHAFLARQAYLNFGKGRHKAGLNYGDCFAYALAKATGEPLLYKGKDFSLTDVEPAI